MSIVPKRRSSEIYLVNIATPETMEHIAVLVEYVEKYIDWIIPPGAYDFLVESYKRGRVLHRPGYKFTFAFEDKRVAIHFQQTFGGELLPR